MARLIDKIVDPDRPQAQPLEVNLRAIALVGTLAWALGAIGCGIWWLIMRTTASSPPAMGLWICLAGIGLGFLALRWVRRHPQAGHNN